MATQTKHRLLAQSVPNCSVYAFEKEGRIAIQYRVSMEVGHHTALLLAQMRVQYIGKSAAAIFNYTKFTCEQRYDREYALAK